MDGEQCEQIFKEETSVGDHFEFGAEADTEPSTTNRKRGISRQVSEDFACAVCFLLAVQPTSLLCGHTFCRTCLAKWYLASGKKQCPLCGQAYQGHPKINIHIKNMMEKLCPTQLSDREKSLDDSAEDKEILRRFDEALRIDTRRMYSTRAFCHGIIFSVFVAITAYLTWYWRSSERSSFAVKPVKLWKPHDVTAWLEDFTWASVYANKSIETNTDGSMLLALSEESLLRLFNVSEPAHQAALLSAVAILKERDIKMPSTLWEYKNLFPGRCLFIAHGMKAFPRTTILCLWMYFYEEMFTPFLKVTTDTMQTGTETALNISVASTMLLETEIKTSQWVSFSFNALALPQWLVVSAAYQMITHDSFTLVMVVTNAILIQVLEIFWLLSFFSDQWEERDITRSLVNYGKHLLLAFTCMVIWPIIPGIFCDILFYCSLYVRPLVMCRSVYLKLRQPNIRLRIFR
ncbi:hypothetical protein BsWGS_06009 [Bradybaena similaris]